MDKHDIYQVFELIIVLFETFIVQQYVKGFFERSSKTHHVIIGYIVFFTGLAATSLIYRQPSIQPIVSLSYTVIGIFVLEHLFYYGQKSSKFFSTLFFAMLMIVADIFCTGIVSIIGLINLNDTYEYGMPRALFIVIAKIVQIFIVKAAGTIIKWRRDPQNNFEIKRVGVLFPCQIFSIILLYRIFIDDYETQVTTDSLSLPNFLAILGIMYINVVLFWYFDNVKAAYEYKRQKELAETKLTYKIKYYELLDKRQREIESFEHDIKKHISAVKELYGKHLQEATEQYINGLEIKYNAIPKILHTSAPVIDALIMDTLRMAKKKDIKIQTEINISDILNIDTIDLCIVLGNTLENAVEACGILQKGVKRVIDLTILQEKSVLLIDIKNPYNPLQNKVSKDNRRHGYGLKNVANVVKKHGGDIKLETDGDFYYVSVIIPY